MSAASEVSRCTSAYRGPSTISRLACSAIAGNASEVSPVSRCMTAPSTAAPPGSTKVSWIRHSASYPVLPAVSQSGGQRLGALEDLLDDHPRAAARLAQPRQVAGGVGEAVRVVDPQAVDRAVREQRQDQRVRGVEHRRVLDADREQRADVEEPPVVELLVGHPPVREPVVLALDQLRQRQRLGARADREHVVVVAQDGPRALAGDLDLVQRQLVAAQHGTDAVAEHGHEHRAVARGPVHVEPVRVRGVRPLGQHRPQRAVVPDGRGDGHVVGHDVEHQPEARVVRRRRPAGAARAARPARERSRRGRRRRTRASSPARPAGSATGTRA